MEESDKTEKQDFYTNEVTQGKRDQELQFEDEENDQFEKKISLNAHYISTSREETEEEDEETTDEDSFFLPSGITDWEESQEHRALAQGAKSESDYDSSTSWQEDSIANWKSDSEGYKKPAVHLSNRTWSYSKKISFNDDYFSDDTSEEASKFKYVLSLLIFFSIYSLQVTAGVTRREQHSRLPRTKHHLITLT